MDSEIDANAVEVAQLQADLKKALRVIENSSKRKERGEAKDAIRAQVAQLQAEVTALTKKAERAVGMVRATKFSADLPPCVWGALDDLENEALNPTGGE